MGGVTTGVKVQDKEVRDLFKRLKKQGEDFTPVMKVIGEILRTSAVKNFEAGGRPKWEPLSLATLFSGRKGKFTTKKGRFKKGVEEKFRNRRVLIKSSRLMSSINSKASKDRTETGTNAIYAAIHQFGGDAGRGRKVKIPARPFLMVQDEDMTEIRQSITAHIMAAEKGGR